MDDFPFATFLIIVSLYFIGFFISDFSVLKGWGIDIFGRNILKDDMRERYAMVPEFRWQNQVFTYYFIHFALVHYAYSILLMLYYVQGLEKATNRKFIIVTYFLFGILWPIIMGPVLFQIIGTFPRTNDYILKQTTFLGSSVPVWGQIGLTVPISRKRRLYWFGLFVLLVVEFALKIMFNQDVTANVTHVLIFFLSWFIAAKFIDFGEHNWKIGELKPDRRIDIIITLLIIINAVIMTLFFWDKITLK